MQNNYKPPTTNQKLTSFKFLILLMLFTSTFFNCNVFGQTSSGVALNWNSYVGCQQFG